MADFDRDGRLDVGWRASTFPIGGGIVVQLGNGDGTFREAGRFPADAPSATWPPAISTATGYPTSL